MAIFNNSIIPAGAAAAPDVVTKSLRLEDDAYISFTPSTATTTRTKAVINFWFKLAEPETSSARYCQMFTAGTVQGAGTVWFGILYTAETGTLKISNEMGVAGGVTTNAVFRDYGAWYNLHLIADTTESASSDRLKLYIRVHFPHSTSIFALAITNRTDSVGKITPFTTAQPSAHRCILPMRIFSKTRRCLTLHLSRRTPRQASLNQRLPAD